MDREERRTRGSKSDENILITLILFFFSSLIEWALYLINVVSGKQHSDGGRDRILLST